MGQPRKIPVKHLPSPRSPILLKIVAIETYSGNIPRLNRRRQFFDRVGSPSAANLNRGSRSSSSS
jgi:hypothetical protein